MAEAAQQGSHAGASGATDGSDRSGTSADRRSCTPAVDNNSAASAAAAASTSQLGTPQLSTTVLTAVSQGSANSNIAAPGGKTAAKTGSGASAERVASGSMPPTDPVALAMLIAASGMQVGGSAAASSASDGPSSGATDAGGGKPPTIAATGAATNLSATPPAGGPPHAALPLVAGSPGAADLLAVVAPAQQSPPARADAAAALNASTAGGSPQALAPALAKTATPDSPPAQPPALAGPVGLTDLARSLAAPAPSPAVQGAIAVPVSDPQWPHAVAAQVHWFVNNDVQSATLRLSPEHLGPLEVHIDVQQSQVNVSFNATHAETRVALEQTVPRLREIFASSGLTLGQANVQQDPRPGSQSAAAAPRPAFAHAQTVEPVAVAAVHMLGLVDEYV